jgi:RHH-type proline utilization regulon transcriptional repressor/proline dehydrogenase/delta 1-pyrroline-5-carboxylate dehydrogenase
MKRSSVGWGLKAGGKNYLLGFGSFTDECAHLSDVEWLETARLSDVRWITERFAKFDNAADPGKLRSEANYKSYHPTPVVIRLGAGVDASDRRVKRLMGFVERVKQVAGVSLDVQVSTGNDSASRKLQNPAAGLRVIMLGEPDETVTQLRSNPDVTIFDNSVVVDGLVTGLMMVRERSTSITTHRYGNTFEVPLG